MFHSMRLAKQALSDDASIEVLNSAVFGTLSLNGEYPYAVPLNFAYSDGCIYFHCAKSGEKLERIRQNSKVSFCAVGSARVISEKYNTVYRSVICFGDAEILQDEEQRRKGFRLLVEKYALESVDRFETAYSRSGRAAEIVCIHIHRMTGKFNEL